MRKEKKAMTLRLTSPAFSAGGTIPRKHTGEGEDVSPTLAWEGAPTGTQEFALICDDPDAPTPKPWVHWVLYQVPPDRQGLAEGEKRCGLEGLTSWDESGYRGPMPPPRHGIHHYYFKLYALDQTVSLGEGATKEELLAAIEGHVLAEGELVGTYER
jgi:Raf kinase inhibitor-like YbhB/YbcL family protein